MTRLASSGGRMRVARGGVRRTMRLLAAICLAAAGCVQQPVIAPTDPTRAFDQNAIDQALGECKAKAEAAGESPTSSRSAPSARSIATAGAIGGGSGAVGGAIVGSPGTGAAVGAATAATATVLRSALKPTKPNPAYRKLVERCLKKLGYKVTSWQ